jgi:protein phosphatase
VGTHAEVTVDTYRWHTVPGDMLLLCTDGLVNMVSDDDIKEVFRKYGTAVEIAQHLVALANENGGKDNITVIVVSISPAPIRHIYMKTHAFFKKHGFTIGWILFLILYGLLCGVGGYFAKQFQLIDKLVEKL